MKAIFAGIFVTTSWLGGYAQGTVNFINYAPWAGMNAPVYHSDGVTPLSGPQFMAELLGGASASNLVSIDTTTFLEGIYTGYFVGGGPGGGESESIPGVPGGWTAWVRVRVWNTVSGGTFSQAQASGLPDSWWESSIFSVVTGGGGSTPTLPADLTGLGDSPVYLNSVPEPSTLVVGAVGTVFVLVGRRRQYGYGAHSSGPK